MDLKKTYKFYSNKFSLQLNLYRMAYIQSYGESIDFLYCLRLRNDLKELKIINIDEYFAKKHLLEFYNSGIDI